MRIYIFVLMLFFFSKEIIAQDTLINKNIIKIRIDGIYQEIKERKIGGATLAYERLLYNNRSFQLETNYYNNYNDWNREKSNYLCFIPQYRFYTDKSRNHEGFYIGPYLRYEMEFRQEEWYSLISKTQLHKAGIGALIGGQKSFFKRIYIDFTLGFDANRYIYIKTIDNPTSYRSLLEDFKLGVVGLLYLGYGFK